MFEFRAIKPLFCSKAKEDLKQPLTIALPTLSFFTFLLRSGPLFFLKTLEFSTNLELVGSF